MSAKKYVGAMGLPSGREDLRVMRECPHGGRHLFKARPWQTVCDEHATRDNTMAGMTSPTGSKHYRFADISGEVIGGSVVIEYAGRGSWKLKCGGCSVHFVKETGQLMEQKRTGRPVRCAKCRGLA